MKNILVTGSRGFIGNELCKKLSNDNFNVTGTRRKNQKRSRYYDEIVIDEEEGFEGGGDKFDVIFHLAGRYSPINSSDKNDIMIRDNIHLTNQLIQFISDARTPVITTGSYFQKFHEGKIPFSEYSIYKNGAKNLLELLSQRNGNYLRYIYLYDTYGVESHRKKFIDQTLNAIINNQILLASPGQQMMNITSVDDVVNGLIQSIETLQSSNLLEEYQIKSEESLTLIQIVEQVEKAFNKNLKIEWGAKPYREQEVFKLWESAPNVPNLVYKDTLTLYIQKNLEKFNAQE